VIIAIEREWAKHPGWFATLDEHARVRLMAEWNVRHRAETPKVKR
jgi:hypothetical protein